MLLADKFICHHLHSRPAKNTQNFKQQNFQWKRFQHLSKEYINTATDQRSALPVCRDRVILTWLHFPIPQLQVHEQGVCYAFLSTSPPGNKIKERSHETSVLKYLTSWSGSQNKNMSSSPKTHCNPNALFLQSWTIYLAIILQFH